MLIALAVVFPLLLLWGLVGMERVERPLRVDEFGRQIDAFLDSEADEAEAYVSRGLKPAVDRYWRHRPV